MSNVDRFSVLLEPGEAVNTQELATWLQNSLSNRLGIGVIPPRALTPLVGYGALQVDADEVIPWDANFQAEVECRYGEASAELSFLTDVVDSRIGEKGRHSDHTAHQKLTDARVAVFELAHHATHVFVSSWGSALRSVTNWSKHSIPLREDLRDSLLQTTTKCVEALREVPTLAPNDGTDLLGAPALARRLERIGVELDESYRLHGTAVEYCTQAFWHVMTFDAPVYPRYDELAFQVSLCLGSTSDYPHRRAAPPSAVQRTAFRHLSNCVARSVQRGFADVRSTPSERDRLYQSLADVLHASFEYFTDDRFDPSPFATTQEAKNMPDETHSISLTTNFDLELERALAVAKPGAHYHVALPVFVANPAPEETERMARASLRWLVGAFATSDVDEQGPSRSKLTEPVSDQEFGGWRWFDTLRPGDLRGPLVVKLSGSPCHTLPQRLHDSATLKNGPNSYLHHATLLDEIDFIQAVQADTAMFVNGLKPISSHGEGEARSLAYGLPEWLHHSLRSRWRLWLLCGTRLADWTLRLHLFMQLSRLDPHSRTNFFDVAKDVGDDRAHLLRWLGVLPLRGDCSDLSGPLAQVADDMRSL